MFYVGSLLLGYIIGSFPTAFLLVRWKSRIDIRAAGSGNVGAMNTFDVTRSKALGIAVFLIDVLKGMASVHFGKALLGDEFWISGAAGIGSVIGHNYNPWLRFKGGRGLSTAVGVMILLGWIVIPIWCLVWVIHFVMSRNIHHANISATLVTPVALMVSPRDWLSATLPPMTSTNEFLLFACCMFLLILIRHKEYIFQKPASIKQ